VSGALRRWLGTAARLAAWGCVGLVALLSLLPAEAMVRTSLGGHVEHAIAYAGTAVLLRLGYPEQGFRRVVIPLVAYAGLLEYLQHFSPGRTAAGEDWLSSSIGVVVGSSVAHGVGRTFLFRTSRCNVQQTGLREPVYAAARCINGSVALRSPWRLALTILTAAAWLPVLAFIAAVWLTSGLGCRLDVGSVQPCIVAGRDIGGPLLATTLISGLTGTVAIPIIVATSVIWILLWRRHRRSGRAEGSL
jgi:hypothetical protein